MSSTGVTPSNKNSLSQTPSLSHLPSGSIANTESGVSRRSGGSGSFGSGSTSRPSSNARGNQSQRKQHKPSRRSRFADEDAMAEANAVKSTSSRKGQTSITHLMNFSLPPRPQSHHHPPINRHGRRNPTWGLGSGYHAVDKARYVHANYRFIVNPKGNYHAQAVDANVHLDWGMVLQILVSAQTQSSMCPICLSVPTAPRMAKCGHIFCLPCLIRYMHSTDEANPIPEKKARWQKCPICWDSIYTSETRPVRWYMGPEGADLRDGGDVLLRLLTRQVGSTLALPKESCEALTPLEDVPWYHVAEVIDYARVMKGGEDYMTVEYESEIKELQRQEREDELMFGDDTTWTKKAVTAIKEAIERVKGIGNPPNTPVMSVEKRHGRLPVKFTVPDEGVPEMYAYQLGIKSGQSSSSTMTTPSTSEPVSVNASTQSVNLERKVNDHSLIGPFRQGSKSAGPSTTSFNASTTSFNGNPYHPFYFYQALPHYYLSPLDIRILKEAFGDFSLFPSTVLPRIEHISTGHVVDDDLRKRAKYLAHLPYGCEVSFLECDWTDLVNPSVSDKFKMETDRRRKRNREKELREEKERVRAEKAEDDARWAATRRKRSTVFSDRDFQPLAHNSTPPENELISTSPPFPTHNPTQSNFTTLASPSTSPMTARTVWGTAMITSTSPPMEPIHHTLEIHDDGWLQGWENDLLGDDELISQIEATNSKGVEQPTTQVNPGGKKKKNKKITLMSTSNARRVLATSPVVG